MILHRRLRNDGELRACFLVHYRHNPINFIEDMCITYDPRVETKIMPFLLFPRQKEFVQFIVECLRDKQGGLAEKCRDMGLTWLCVCLAVWLWLFEPASSVGFGSRKQELVDRPGDPDSIFEKIRMQIRGLPDFMMPRDFTPRMHMTYMKLMNPENSATITGEIGDNIGRGGRKQIYFKDESAHYERPELIEAALGDNTDVPIDISSVNGSANVFYRRRMAGTVWMPGEEMPKGKTRIFIFDWRQNPLKSQEWYDLRRSRADAEGLLYIFAQEVDRDYRSSIDNVIIQPEWVDAAIDAHIKLGIKEGPERIAGQDIADEGGDKNALVIRHGIVLRYADHWAGLADDAPQIAMMPCIEHSVTDLYYDSIGVGVGFRAGLKNVAWPARCKVHPWSAAAEVLEPTRNVIAGDRESPKNEDQYENLKAQSWFRLRTRFVKTYKAVREGKEYPANELISLDSTLPRLQELKMELSQAVHKPSARGKTMVDKKPDGAVSPNMADGVVIGYNPIHRNTVF